MRWFVSDVTTSDPMPRVSGSITSKYAVSRLGSISPPAPCINKWPVSVEP